MNAWRSVAAQHVIDVLSELFTDVAFPAIHVRRAPKLASIAVHEWITASTQQPPTSLGQPLETDRLKASTPLRDEAAAAFGAATRPSEVRRLRISRSVLTLTP